MLSGLQTHEYDSCEEQELKHEKQEHKPEILDGWVLTPQQRSFIESFFDESL